MRCSGFGFSEFRGEDGRPVRRTKYTHPYSYDPFVIWEGNGKANSTDYTDRLFEWDYGKAQNLCAKHMPGKRWDNASPSEIQAFLRAYHDNQSIRLVRVMEYCDASSGYPVWRLDYHYDAKASS